MTVVLDQCVDPLPGLSLLLLLDLGRRSFCCLGRECTLVRYVAAEGCG